MKVTVVATLSAMALSSAALSACELVVDDGARTLASDASPEAARVDAAVGPADARGARDNEPDAATHDAPSPAPSTPSDPPPEDAGPSGPIHDAASPPVPEAGLSPVPEAAALPESGPMETSCAVCTSTVTGCMQACMATMTMCMSGCSANPGCNMKCQKTAEVCNASCATNCDSCYTRAACKGPTALVCQPVWMP